jgi:hypothetical protein
MHPSGFECWFSTTLLSGSAYELELSPEMETKGLCDFGGGAQ